MQRWDGNDNPVPCSDIVDYVGLVWIVAELQR